MGVFSIRREDLEAHNSQDLLYPSRTTSPQSVEVVCCGSDYKTPQHNGCVPIGAYSTRLRKVLTSIHRGGVLWFQSQNASTHPPPRPPSPTPF